MMRVQRSVQNNPAYRFNIEIDGLEVARATLQLVRNDLHDRPYGLLEDVFVEKDHRSKGCANALLSAIIEQANHLQMYKIIATSRDDGTRESIHAWYQRLGFQIHGIEFRMEL